EYLDQLLWVEGRRGLGDICSKCHDPNPTYRCVDDECVRSGMMCKDCIVATHETHPLHWIECWNGRWFEPRTLKDLGLVIQLGNHKPGEKCIFYTAAHSDFVVVHTNGVHNVTVWFCGCCEEEHRTQLLRTLWYPATPMNPQTATTFSCLRQFQHLNCQGKLPAYIYYTCLEIMTKSRQRIQPKDCYRTFLRSVFQWRHLKMCKRAGRGHAANGLEGTSQGELALDCPACPQPGKNLPDNWRDVPPELAFLYIIFLAIDANFRLRNRLVSTQYKSPLLGDGWAYLVPSVPYMEHIEKFVSQDDMSSCSGFAAMFLANLRNVKGLRVSGVGGICCGRHRVWRKNGLGDLQKGERYCNIDYIFWATVNGEEHLIIVISYDISCQWSRNFWERMSEIDPHFDVKFTRTGVRFMVPKFHLRAHQSSCHFKYAFDYASGCGETHGEVIEEGWAQSNKAAGQTKEMGPGTRAMTLDDIFGFANWLNIENLDRVIAKRLVNAVKEFDEHERDFTQFDQGLEKNLGREVLDEWKRMIEKWEEDHDNECPYEDSEQGKCIFLLQLELIGEEKAMLSAGTSGYASSPCVFVVEGIELQEAHLELFLVTNKYLTPTQQLELEKRRSALLKRINRFRSLQSMLMPRLSDVLSPEDMKHIDNPDTSHPEKIRLFLPSECGTISARNQACVAGLPMVECRLREAEALDSLEGVREGLRARTAATRFKIQNITGQVDSTRAGGVLRQIDIRIHSRKIRYRLARDALLILRGHGTWEEKLKLLKDEDVRGLNERALTKEEQAERELRIKRLGAHASDLDGDDEYLVAQGVVARVRGEKNRKLSWIWYTLKEGEISEDDPQFPIRVEWCKARARMLRWKEEVLLLTEELRRMSHYAVWKAEWWLEKMVGKENIRDDVSAEFEEGLNAYSWQQAKFQEERAVRIRDRWNQLGAHAKAVVDRIPTLPTLYIDFEDLDTTEVSRKAEEDM
ncbi:hypothetical protein K435DRAFT_668134, partial [Dendrothele bispora CBS 962.96]